MSGDLLRPVAGSAGATGERADVAVRDAVPTRNELRFQGVILARAAGGRTLEVDSGAQRHLMTAERALPAAAVVGQRVGLEVEGRDGRARLLTIGGRAVDRPVEVTLRTVAPREPAAAPSLPHALRTIATIIDPTGRPLATGGVEVVPLIPSPARSATGTSFPPPAIGADRAGKQEARSAPQSGQPAATRTGSAVAPNRAETVVQPPQVTAPKVAAGRAAPPTSPLPDRATTVPDRPLTAEVIGRDPSGLILRSGEHRIRIEGALHLPDGARLRLLFTAPPGSSPQSHPMTGTGGASRAPHPLPPDPTLAARLIGEMARLIGDGASDRPTPPPANALPEAPPRPDNAPANPVRPVPGESAGLAARIVQAVTGRLAAHEGPAEATDAPATDTRSPAVTRSDAASGSRVLELTIGMEPDVVPLQVHLRVQEEPRREERGRVDRPARGRVARAIFSADFEHLGRCQLDVLCDARRFDLTVRSPHSLPDEVRRQAAMLFLTARDIGGLRGEIVFAPGDLVDLASDRRPRAGSLTA